MVEHEKPFLSQDAYYAYSLVKSKEVVERSHKEAIF